LRDLLARFLISSALRSRIRTSSATIDVTSAATAPLESMSAMNWRTAPRSGSIALVIGGGESFDSVIARRNLRLCGSLSSVGRAILDSQV
jgi:hypothetical protein